MSRILVVEDDNASAEMMQAVLEEEGYTVDIAYSLVDAVADLRRQPADLVLRDTMAHTPADFLAAADPILALAEHPPVVIVSAHALDEDEMDIRGYQGLIPKPFDIEEFCRKVAAYLRRAGPA